MSKKWAQRTNQNNCTSRWFCLYGDLDIPFFLPTTETVENELATCFAAASCRCLSFIHSSLFQVFNLSAILSAVSALHIMYTVCLCRMLFTHHQPINNNVYHGTMLGYFAFDAACTAVYTHGLLSLGCNYLLLASQPKMNTLSLWLTKLDTDILLIEHPFDVVLLPSVHLKSCLPALEPFRCTFSENS